MKRLSGHFYRLIETARAGEILAPAHSPEGRFHHDGQRAIYLSETEEGARVAMATFSDGTETPLSMFALRLNGAKLLDLRDKAQCARMGIDPSVVQNRWQIERAEGKPASTWRLSDAARAVGADCILYPSRKRPDLRHLVVFKWNQPDSAQLSCEWQIHPGAQKP